EDIGDGGRGQRHLALHRISLAAKDDQAHQHQHERQDQRQLDGGEAFGVGAEARATMSEAWNRDCPHHPAGTVGSTRNTWVEVISIFPLPRFAKLRPSGPPKTGHGYITTSSMSVPGTALLTPTSTVGEPTRFPLESNFGRSV